VGARLQPVLDNLKRMKELGIWIEVTTLILQGINDSPEELGDIAGFLVEVLGPETPWHISRSMPAYQMLDLKPTPVTTIEQAREIGEAAGLHHVYMGNVPGETSTRCAECSTNLVRRAGYRVLDNRVAMGGVCPTCSSRVGGVGMAPGESEN
jgi:pyruvate formate lyase activating enzyme